MRLTIVPPPHTVAHLSGGVIDGYCVGEPWNQQARRSASAASPLTGPDIWKGMPEKVLGTTEAWAENNPETMKALIKALIEACPWLDEPANRAEAARVLSSPRYLNMPAEVMPRTLGLARLPRLPSRDARTSRGAAMPTGSWRRWCAGSQARRDIDIKAAADRVYRTDIYRAAARRDGRRLPRHRSPAAGRRTASLLLPPIDATTEKSSRTSRSGEANG